MNNPIQLDYHTESTRRWSTAAIFAVILGVCCGPIMVFVVHLTGIAYGISTVGSGCVAAIGIPVIIYCCLTYTWVSRHPHLRGRNLALIGCIATILWMTGLIALFCYIETQLT